MEKQQQKTKNQALWVVKIGSALLTDDGAGVDQKKLLNWAKQIATLSQSGIACAIVSSGAVTEGLRRLNWKQYPQQRHKLQVAAAVGQMRLVQNYESCFQQFSKQTAQILLTHDDMTHRTRYLNARVTLMTLLKLGIIPIINENDTVAIDEMTFDDNDTLAGMVANLINAELLIILTDQKGLYTADPRKDKNATLIHRASIKDRKLMEYAGGSHIFGRGGMKTKIQAAIIAARSATNTFIVSGKEEDVLLKIFEKQQIGTLLVTPPHTMQSRRRWLANQRAQGSVVLDDGAIKALVEHKKSLLPIGITSVTGKFRRGAVILCIDQSGKEIARGLTNYDSPKLCQVLGKSSKQIQKMFDTPHDDECIHRDNLMLNDMI